MLLGETLNTDTYVINSCECTLLTIRNTVIHVVEMIDLNNNVSWNRNKEKTVVTCFSPDETSTSTGKISSSWEGAGWLALIRINAV